MIFPHEYTCVFLLRAWGDVEYRSLDLSPGETILLAQAWRRMEDWLTLYDGVDDPTADDVLRAAYRATLPGEAPF